MYDPSIQKVEVIRLEKRLDDELLYLRDALPEYSTFDLNMEPEIMTEGATVPVNDTKVKIYITRRRSSIFNIWHQYITNRECSIYNVNVSQVKLKPRPWLERWERKNLKGVQDLGLQERFYKRAEQLATPWEKYDLMKQYRYI